MTLPRERTSAVIRAREFLLRLAVPRGGIKRVPREVRQEARRLLRHYPGWYDLSRADAFDAEAARLEGNRETDEEWLRSISATKTEATPDKCSVPPDWTSKPYYVDPPEGWRWGFPRLYDPAKDGDMTEWMIRNGYPQRLADQGLACTFTACTETGEK